MKKYSGPELEKKWSKYGSNSPAYLELAAQLGVSVEQIVFEINERQSEQVLVRERSNISADITEIRKSCLLSPQEIVKGIEALSDKYRGQLRKEVTEGRLKGLSTNISLD